MAPQVQRLKQTLAALQVPAAAASPGRAGGCGDAVEETTDEMTDEMIEIFEQAAEPTEDSLQSLGFPESTVQTCEQTTNPMRASMVQRAERLFGRTSADRPMAETLLSPTREYPEFGGAWGRLTPPPPFPPCHFHTGPHQIHILRAFLALLHPCDG